MNVGAASSYDLVTVGRSSIDLYANEIGAPFDKIQSFGAFVGGCPTNIAVGGRRLGLRTLLLTALGDDPVGDFVLAFLNHEGVVTDFIPRKPGFRTSAVLLGIQPPDKFPLVYYRQGCADAELDIDNIAAAPIDQARSLLITGTGLTVEPSRSATLLAAEKARKGGAKVIFDLDFRLDQWHDARAYGVTARAALSQVDIAIGTEEEVKMAASTESTRVQIADSQISSPEVVGDLATAIEVLFARGLRALILKLGSDGAEVHKPGTPPQRVNPFAVEVVNVLGAGDGFAAGFIYGLLEGWKLDKAARMGNAVGAILVTQQGCANFMPTIEETFRFIDNHGGF